MRSTGADSYEVLFSLSMATENCTFLTTENCTLRAGAFGSDHVAGMTLPRLLADVADALGFAADASPPKSLQPAEGCIYDDRWSQRTDLEATDLEPDRVFRIEQDSENLTGVSWVFEEGQQPFGP